MPDIPFVITDNCTGCGICSSRCPVKCIGMEPDLRGFLQPVINPGVCIGCELCVTSCPSNHPVVLNRAEAAFACWALDEAEHKSSTSGGVASVVSRKYVRNGGVVYGSAFVGDTCDVVHIRVDNEAMLAQLKGSKYIQSSVVDCLPSLMTDLKEGREVLFVGTPCQVAGVKRLAEKYADRLLTIDLVCHGVPSVRMFRDHVQSLHLDEKPDALSFRERTEFCLQLFSGGRLLYKASISRKNWCDLYYNAFYRSLTYRQCCYQCPYARPERPGDLTIGDFWGVGKKTPLQLYPEDGISLVLPNTEKGQQILVELTSELYCEKRLMEEAVEGNDQLSKSSRKTWRTLLFYYLYPRIRFRYAVMVSAADWIGKTVIKSFIHRYRKC